MGPKRTKWSLVLFIAAFAITTAELCWWVTFNLRETAKLAQKEALLQEREMALASQLWAAYGAPTTAPSQDFLQRFFPRLEVDDKTARIMVKEQYRAPVGNVHAGHVRMFVAEGAFFFFMMLLGAGLIVRTIRREVGVVRQQANFLNAITHELKSPLAAMRLYIETLESRPVDPQTLARYVGTLRAECDRLEVLVGHVLTLARLESPHHGSNPAKAVSRWLDIDDEVAKVLQQLASQHRDCNVQIDHQRALVPLYVSVDEASLRTILRNLVHNACKYGAAKHKVIVRVAEASGRASIAVQDFGIGIDQDEQQRIFERFYRVGNEMTRSHEGTGLGLYLVRMLLQEYQGNIEVYSEGANKGATFTVSLPAVASKPQLT